MRSIQKISAGSAFKVGGMSSALLFAFFGGIMLAIYILLFLVFGAGSNFQNAGAIASMGIVGSIIGYIVGVIVYGLMGGIVAAVYALFYNLVANLVGGIQIELK